MREHALIVRDLSVVYATKQDVVHAVNQVDLAVRPGEILGIIGESGSGKSTLGRAILGLLPAQARVTGGSIRIGDEQAMDIAGARGSELRRYRGSWLALVPQATAGALTPVLRVDAQFALTLHIDGITDKTTIRERTLDALRATGLADPERVMRSYPHQLSGGMAQRVVLALAMLRGPRVLVADEPTSALDVTTQRVVLDNLATSVRESGRACLLVTHDLRVAAHYCDRIVVMYGGFVVEAGLAKAVLFAPRHPYTKALLAAVPGRQKKSAPLMDRPRVEPAGPHCPYLRVCRGQLDPRCTNELPALREVGPDHLVRTFCA